MKARFSTSLTCECDYVLFYSSAYDNAGNKQPVTVECANQQCKHKGIKFALPTIELEEVKA